MTLKRLKSLEISFLQIVFPRRHVVRGLIICIICQSTIVSARDHGAELSSASAWRTRRPQTLPIPFYKKEIHDYMIITGNCQDTTAYVQTHVNAGCERCVSYLSSTTYSSPQTQHFQAKGNQMQAKIQKQHDEAQLADKLVQLDLEGKGLQKLEESLLELHVRVVVG